MISAGVMASVALALTYLGGWWFVSLVIIGVSILHWEWTRMVSDQPLNQTFWMGSVGLVTATVVAALGQSGAALVVVLATSAAVYLLAQKVRPGLSAFGIGYLGFPAVVLVMTRFDPLWGLAAIVLMFVIVWGADTGAYIAGRSIGGPKLWPAVSPKKTWSGFIGGLAVGGILAALWSIWVGQESWPVLFLIGVMLAFTSHVGDLLESHFKRKLGVKDTSGLIPGHGGLLDRVDGLLFVAIAVYLLGAIRGTSPASAVAHWPF